MTDLIAHLMALPVDTYLLHAGVIVVRVTDYKYLVLRNGTVTTFGGKRAPLDYVAARVVECVTGERIEPLCARCGVNEREEKSYCLPCYRAIQVEHARTYRQRQKDKRHAA